MKDHLWGVPSTIMAHCRHLVSVVCYYCYVESLQVCPPKGEHQLVLVEVGPP